MSLTYHTTHHLATIRKEFQAVRLSTLARIWDFGLAVFGALVAYGLLDQAGLYNAPAFETVRLLAPLEVWAALWGLGAVGCLWSSLTGRFTLNRVGQLLMIGVAFCWFLALSYEHFIDKAAISPSGYALWMWFVLANVLSVSSPTQFRPVDGAG